MNTAKRIAIAMILSGSFQLAVFGQNGVDLDPPSPNDVDRQFDDSILNDESSNQAGSAGGGISTGAPLGNDLALGEADTISVDFPNEEIRTVLRNVADLYMLNIVIPEDLQGTTSIKLRDVSWRQIFKVVLDPIGFSHVEEGNIIKITSNETLNFEPPITEIFMLNYAEAGEISGTVSSMVDTEKGGQVQIDARTNGLIVTERQSRMGSIREVINRLDKPTMQVMIETRFVEVTNQDVTKIGVRWNSLENLEVSADGISRQYFDTRGRNQSNDDGLESNREANFGTTDLAVGDSEISGDPGLYNGRFIDNLTGQTLLDATSRSDSLVQQDAVRNLKSLVHTGSVSRATNAVFSSSQIGFILSALKRQGNSRLVSHPTVVTLNNQEAEISIGEQYPIPNYQYNEERGTFEVSGFDYKDIGVILKVKPSVNNQGLITMKVVPEVSSRTGEREFGGASGASIPIISTRRTMTQIALQDGYTMGLGGLLQASEVENLSKVPLLHKIPGIGGAFRHKDKDGQKMNLLIFITAKILPSEDADFEDVFTQERISEVGLDLETLRNQ